MVNAMNRSFHSTGIAESVWLVQTHRPVVDCRLGADFLNAVGKYGSARYSNRVSGIPEIQVVPRSFSP